MPNGALHCRRVRRRDVWAPMQGASASGAAPAFWPDRHRKEGAHEVGQGRGQMSSRFGASMVEPRRDRWAPEADAHQDPGFPILALASDSRQRAGGRAVAASLFKGGWRLLGTHRTGPGLEDERSLRQPRLQDRRRPVDADKDPITAPHGVGRLHERPRERRVGTRARHRRSGLDHAWSAGPRRAHPNLGRDPPRSVSGPSRHSRVSRRGR